MPTLYRPTLPSVRSSDAGQTSFPGSAQVQMVLQQLTVQRSAVGTKASLQLVMGQPGRLITAEQLDQSTKQSLGGRERRPAFAYRPLAGRSRATSSARPCSPLASSRAFALRKRSVAARTAATSAAGSITKRVFEPWE